MVSIKSHADFKRVLGNKKVKLETLTLANGVKGGRLNIGDVRYINMSDTTGVYLKKDDDVSDTRGSFLGFDRASDWVFNDDVATHRLGMSYRLIEVSA